MIREFINKNFKIFIHLSFCPLHFEMAKESVSTHCKAYDSHRDSLSAFSFDPIRNDGENVDLVEIPENL